MYMSVVVECNVTLKYKKNKQFLSCHIGIQGPQTRGGSHPQKLEVGSCRVTELLHTVQKNILYLNQSFLGQRP